MIIHVKKRFLRTDGQPKTRVQNLTKKKNKLKDPLPISACLLLLPAAVALILWFLSMVLALNPDSLMLTRLVLMSLPKKLLMLLVLAFVALACGGIDCCFFASDIAARFTEHVDRYLSLLSAVLLCGRSLLSEHAEPLSVAARLLFLVTLNMSRLGEKLTGVLLLALACWDGKCLRENNRGLDKQGGFV